MESLTDLVTRCDRKAASDTKLAAPMADMSLTTVTTDCVRDCFFYCLSFACSKTVKPDSAETF